MNITKAVERYVSERPSIKDCLKRRLINYSALSRMISTDTGIRNFDALLIACRRYATKLKSEQVMEERIIRVLKGSKVEVKNKIIAVVIKKGVYHDDLLKLEKEIKKRDETLHIMEGSNAITVVTSEEFLDMIRQLFKSEILKISKGLVEINVKSPKEIETTPGVVAQLYSIFWEKGINVVENMSCWTDTLFVIKEEDAAKVIEAFRF